MSYIPFTEQQREQARRTDLAAFLRQCGEEVKRSGSENMWLDHGQKVTIRGNLWFHQYEQVGGDAIDFACRFYNMEYPEAVQLMLAMDAGTIREPVEPFPQKPLEIPQKHENMRRVYGYLLRHRGIDKEVLDAFSYRGLVYESADYHNAVFVGIDREGKPRHIHKHSTAAQGSFKGNAPGSDPEYSFHWVGGGETLFLFEAPIDMLSFISMHKQHWKSSSYAAACGVSDKVLWKTMEGRQFIRMAGETNRYAHFSLRFYPEDETGGTVDLDWAYEGSDDFTEMWSGFWAIQTIPDGPSYVTLSLSLVGGKNYGVTDGPMYLCETYPLLISPSGTELLVGAGESGICLPFMSQSTTACVLTQAVG